MANASPSQVLVREVARHYGVGPRYAKAYLSYWKKTRGGLGHSLDEILAGPAHERMWFEYALSTNWRGEHLFQALKSYLPPRGRYLDVGCGMGGFVVAFAKHGFTVRGIEVDRERLALAEQNCLDHRIHRAVTLGDILDHRTVRNLGTFDVITCIDVIEHVSDVSLALRHMTILLNPGGILVLEIPNKHSLHFVGSDGHFQLFGITLLDRDDAMLYHKHFFSFPYDVGGYFDLPYYTDILSRLHCTTKLIHTRSHPKRSVFAVVPLLGFTLQQYATQRKRLQRLPIKLGAKIRRCFVAYLQTLLREAFLLSPGGFRRKYLTDFWTVIATKERHASRVRSRT
jgi:SAM-dependent methyltransferase